MLAVPFLVMVASTRRGRLVLLTVLCVVVSAIRSSYTGGESSDAAASSFVSMSQFDWPDSDKTISGSDVLELADRPLFWKRLLSAGRALSLQASEEASASSLRRIEAHLSTLVSPEEVADHREAQLRLVETSSAPLQWSLSRFFAATPLLRRRRSGKRIVPQRLPNLDEARLQPSAHSERDAKSLATPVAQDDPLLLESLTEPLMRRNVWESLTGMEFQQHAELVNGLALMGERLIRQISNEWIEWKEYGTQHGVQIWTGRSKLSNGYIGSDVPWIRSRSKIPLSPVELKDLLMDSSRIRTYNPWSTGRQDCWTRSVPDQHKYGQTNHQMEVNSVTKIVKNRVQPPVGSALVGVTLLHARPLDHGAWLVVSRAIGGQAYFDPEDLDSAGRSDMLLGVNLLEPVLDDSESCTMTSITHAASTSVPSMLAERFGVKGAVKFVQDIRKLKVPA